MSNASAVRKAVTRRGALVLALAVPGAAMAQTTPTVRLEVWQDPTCNCCAGWVRHMRAVGFEVVVHQVADVRRIKVARGIDEALWSCHTALVGGYVVEGHVPAADVRRLLAERPRAKGLATLGMPPSAPGMDMPGTPYSIVLFGAPGGDRTWARHGGDPKL